MKHWLFYALVITALFSVVAFADEECHWEHCSVIEGSLSVCAGHKTGDADAMLKYEKLARNQGELFFRECTKTGKTELGWTGGAGMFMRKDRKEKR